MSTITGRLTSVELELQLQTKRIDELVERVNGADSADKPGKKHSPHPAPLSEAQREILELAMLNIRDRKKEPFTYQDWCLEAQEVSDALAEGEKDPRRAAAYRNAFRNDKGEFLSIPMGHYHDRMHNFAAELAGLAVRWRKE